MIYLNFCFIFFLNYYFIYLFIIIYSLLERFIILLLFILNCKLILYVTIIDIKFSFRIISQEEIQITL